MTTFTSISERFQNASYRSRLLKGNDCAILQYKFSQLIEYAESNYKGSYKERNQYIYLVNSLIYYKVVGDSVLDSWDPDDPLNTIDIIDDEYELKSTLGDLYIDPKSILWDIDIPKNDDIKDEVLEVSSTLDLDASKQESTYNADSSSKNSNIEIPHADSDSLKYRSTISLSFPIYPSINTQKLYTIGYDMAGRQIPIYQTLPSIPKLQNDISITTDVDAMTEDNLLSLYPDTIIYPRRDEMYVAQDGYKFHSLFGFIPDIDGFTEDQVIQNIIEYPIFNFMYRNIDGDRISFMKHIEIDGKLIPSKEAIHYISDIEKLPAGNVFLWDYVVRRYLLERDIKHIQHKYPLMGSFTSYMTLFMPVSEYKKYINGFDPIDTARKCVIGRRDFYKSRNPLLKSSVSHISKEHRFCSYSSYCTRKFCDMSCAKNAMADVLFEKSEISWSDLVFRSNRYKLESFWKIIQDHVNSYAVIVAEKSSEIANQYTYAAICNNCDRFGSRVSVYHLKYGKYMQSIRDSWSSGVSSKLKEQNAFISTSNVLVISGLDYVNFRDFECQTLLTILQDREKPGLSTIIVIRDVDSMVGSSEFFKLLKSKLEGGVIK